MRTPVPDQNIAFLAGGGEMGAMMRQHDWSTSPVGPPDGWPQSLRSAVGLMLANKHIMFVAWGADLAFLYNDAFAPCLERSIHGRWGVHSKKSGQRFGMTSSLW